MAFFPVDRDNRIMKIILLLFAVIVLVFALLVMMIRFHDKFVHWQFWRRVEKHQHEAGERFSTELHKPDWALLRQHLKRDVPQRLKDAYANAAFIAKEHHFRGQSLLFVPINEKSVALFERYFTFAELGEDPLFLKPGRDEHDAVYQLPSNDDPDDVFEEISPDIKEFLNELGFTGGLNQRD